jgi:hypothetical protein
MTIIKSNVARRFLDLILAFSFCFYLAAESQAATATQQPQPTLLLGMQNGLVKHDAVAVNNAAQALADFIGNAAGRRVTWEANYTLADASKPAGQGGHFDFVFSRPPNLTGGLLIKGWQLVAVAQTSMEFGIDLIAQACPGKPGQVLLGGPTLEVMGVNDPAPFTCVPVAQVWKSPAAILLTPARGSLVETVARKMWLEHAASTPRMIDAKYQNAVSDFMRFTHACVIGAVTTYVSKNWEAEGGLVLAHQAMPFVAILAAPGTPADTVGKVRAALVGPDAAGVDKKLGLPGWKAGSPKPYVAFMQWLKAKA